MLFNSYVFLFIFLPLVLLIYIFLSRQGLRISSILWLTAGSLYFYGYFYSPYLILLSGSILFNYYISKHINGSPSSKRLLYLGVTANLLLLGYYKYAGLITTTISYFGLPVTTINILLPIGISFFTFQQIAYLIDSYRGQKGDYSLLDYTLFVTFFPQLIAGPIVHHKEMLPQFSQSSAKFQWENISVGLSIFIFGLFKKVVLADNVAIFATPVFSAADEGQTILFTDAWIGALAYTLQIYFDFSGYSDMAIGLARMFGISLPINFDSPYKSFNVSEFWRRWHITLSRFLRDYLYILLGGNRKGEFRRYLNLFLTMLIGGLWHGAGWNFALWGALHGLYLIIFHLYNHAKSDNFRIPPLIAISITMFCVIVAWVPFRATTFDGALIILSAMFDLNSLNFADSLSTQFTSKAEALPWILGLFIIAFLAPNTKDLHIQFRPALLESQKGLRGPCSALTLITWKPNHTWLTIELIMLATIMYELSSISEFIYFQF